MATIALKDADLNGMGKSVHFDEDGPFAGAAVPTSATPAVSGVYDLGEAISGVTIRAFADTAITGAAAGASVAVKIFAGNNKNATAGGTDWTLAATIGGSGTAIAAAGDELGAFTPPPGFGKRYYYAQLEGGTGITAGKVSVYNEITR